VKKINRRERRESCACTGSASTSAMQRGSAARRSLPPPPSIAHHASCNTIGALMLRLCIDFLSFDFPISWMRVRCCKGVWGAFNSLFFLGLALDFCCKRVWGAFAKPPKRPYNM